MSSDFYVPPLGQGSLEEVARLTQRFIDVDATERWGLYEGRDDGGPLSAVATWIERTVFKELFGVDEESVAEEFSPFSDLTVWSVIVHHPTGTAVGAARCLTGPARRLSAATDLHKIWGLSWEEAVGGYADPEDSFFEAVSFSVLPEWRSSDRIWPVKVLCSSYMHQFEDLKANWAVQIINPAVKRLMESWGTPFIELSGPRIIKNAEFIPALLPRIPGRPYFKAKDAEYFALMQHRDESGRGGTRLPSLDLDRKPLVVRVNADVRAQLGERAGP